MGRVTRDALSADDDAAIDGLMDEGPTTVRPSEEIDALSHRMEHAAVEAILVTDSLGHLLGVFERSE